MKAKALPISNQKAAYSEVGRRISEYLNGDCKPEELELLIKGVNCLTSIKAVQIKEGLAKTQIANKPILIEDVERLVGTSLDPEAPKFE